MALQFILIKEKIGYDISDIVQKVSWSGRKNSPARTLQLTLLDDISLGNENRANVDVYKGNHIIFLEDNKELFRGIIMKQTQSQDQTLNIIAYDNAIYLSNNKGSFSYCKKTLTEVFMDVCKKYEINRGETASVLYKIPVISEINKTIYDVLCNAMSQTYKATGERYYIISRNGQLHLLRRREQLTKLVLETGSENSLYGNITQYNYSKSIEKTRTRLVLISKEGKAIASWSDFELEDRIGMMQDVQTPDDTLSKSSLKQIVKTMFDEIKLPSESLSITALGISSIYSGMAVYINIPNINIGRTFYVDSDTHTWDGDYHEMKLTLNFAKNLENINSKGETEVDKSTDSSAMKEAKQAVKDAASALKLKKKAESKVIKAGNAAEKAADSAEKSLKNAEKAKKPEQAIKHAKKVLSMATKALSEYEKSLVALAEAKSLMNMAQTKITTNADFAAHQAEAAVKRANEAAEKAEQYL